MECRIKRIDRDIYFNKHLGIAMCPNHWAPRRECRVFNSVAEARATIKLCKLKNVEVEK
jgi:hypothetical protein